MKLNTRARVIVQQSNKHDNMHTHITQRANAHANLEVAFHDARTYTFEQVVNIPDQLANGTHAVAHGAHTIVNDVGNDKRDAEVSEEKRKEARKGVHACTHFFVVNHEVVRQYDDAHRKCTSKKALDAVEALLVANGNLNVLHC